MPQTSDDHRDLYRISELQERLALGRSTVRSLVAQGAFGPVVRVGRAVRLTRIGVERWIEQQTGGDGT